MPQLTHPLAGTPLFRLVEERLSRKRFEDYSTDRDGGLLDWYIRTQRAAGEPYRRIAFSLVGLTGVDVTSEAVRRWHVSAVTGADDPPQTIPAGQPAA